MHDRFSKVTLGLITVTIKNQSNSDRRQAPGLVMFFLCCVILFCLYGGGRLKA